MSLFIASLAFPEGALHSGAKLGILLGSLIAGAIGALTISRLKGVQTASCVEPEEWVDSK
jgi:Na+/H+ antiporter NhaA